MSRIERTPISGTSLATRLTRAAQVPALRGVFGLEALSRAEWATVLKFAAPILLVEECTKAVGRLLDARALAARKAAEA